MYIINYFNSSIVAILSISAQLPMYIMIQHFRVLPVVLYPFLVSTPVFLTWSDLRILERNSPTSRFKETRRYFEHRVPVVYNPVAVYNPVVYFQ